MCGEEKAYSLAQLGKKLELTDPAEAARNYLLAADLLVIEAKEHPQKEQEYLHVAQTLFLKARELKIKKNTVKKYIKTDQITFADIGGLEELKEEILIKIVAPFQNPDLFKYYGKKAGGGILMYGPPGCGKSLIAKATANEAKVNFIHVKGSNLKSKFVGETEKNIAELFVKAREMQPTIIFFDEFEAIGGEGSETTVVEKNFVAQLLTEMDGMDSKDQQVLLLAATNEPWAIDSALRREGRLGTTIFVPPPDLEARKSILQMNLAGRPTEELDYDYLAELTAGFSGADLKAVCERATDIPLKESLKTGKKRKISLQDVEKALVSVGSVLEEWFAKALVQVEKRQLEEYFAELVAKAKEMEKIVI